MSILKSALVWVLCNIVRYCESTGKYAEQTSLANCYLLRACYWRFVSIPKATIVQLTRVTAVQGHSMRLDWCDTLSLSVFGVWEPNETDFLRFTIKEADIVLDLGAHIGYFTLIAAEQCGASGHVFAFEPDPSNFQLLKCNVDQNGYGSRVTPVCKAIGTETGEIALFVNHYNRGDNRTYSQCDVRTSRVVPSVSLRDYFADRVHIDFVKIDLQGAEGFVQDDLLELLSTSPEAPILAEFWPRGLSQAGTDPDEFVSKFVRNGYAPYVCAVDGQLESADIQRLLKNYTIANGRYANVVWCRGSV